MVIDDWLFLFYFCIWRKYWLEVGQRLNIQSDRTFREAPPNGQVYIYSVEKLFLDTQMSEKLYYVDSRIKVLFFFRHKQTKISLIYFSRTVVTSQSLSRFILEGSLWAMVERLSEGYLQPITPSHQCIPFFIAALTDLWNGVGEVEIMTSVSFSSSSEAFSLVGAGPSTSAGNAAVSFRWMTRK